MNLHIYNELGKAGVQIAHCFKFQRGASDRSPNMNYVQNKGFSSKQFAVLATKILGKSYSLSHTHTLFFKNAGPQITHAGSDTQCAALPLFTA